MPLPPDRSRGWRSPGGAPRRLDDRGAIIRLYVHSRAIHGSHPVLTSASTSASTSAEVGGGCCGNLARRRGVEAATRGAGTPVMYRRCTSSWWEPSRSSRVHATRPPEPDRLFVAAGRVEGIRDRR